MKHLIMYNDVKKQIDGLLPEASNSLYALVALFQDCDDQFQKLINEKTELAENKELSISASMLFDAYELVEDGMNTMGMLIVNVGKDEQRGIHQYVDVSEYIEPAKELMPMLMSMIHTVSSQMSDFIELHKSFVYQNINMLNPISVRQYMDVNHKVSRISTIIHKQMVQQHEELVMAVNQLSEQLTQTSMVMEASESIKGKYFASIIDDISIIEVGKTKNEVLAKTREYFDGDMDDTVKIVPCSDGIFHMVTHDGEIPEEWEMVDGVVVLPDEKSLYEQVNDLVESKGIFKAAAKKIHDNIEDKVRKEFESRVLKVDGKSDGDMYMIEIHPDTILTKEKFGSKDKRVILDIYRKLQNHPWFENVKLSESDKGIITLTMQFGNIDIIKPEKVVEDTNIFENTQSFRHAGFIPYMINDGSVYVMTMIPSDPDFGGTEPQMAKGTIDKGYNDRDTAIKEAHEEVGLKLENIKEVKHMGVMQANKPISVFYAEVINKHNFDDPHWETGWSGWINISKNLSMIRKEQQNIFQKLIELVS